MKPTDARLVRCSADGTWLFDSPRWTDPTQATAHPAAPDTTDNAKHYAWSSVMFSEIGVEVGTSLPRACFAVMEVLLDDRRLCLQCSIAYNGVEPGSMAVVLTDGNSYASLDAFFSANTQISGTDSSGNVWHTK